MAWLFGGFGDNTFCQDGALYLFRIDEKIIEGVAANLQRSRECGEKFHLCPPLL